MAIEAHGFVKMEGFFVEATGHEHDFVAVLLPGKVKHMLQKLPAIPIAAMVSVCDDIFDETIGAAITGEVGDECDGAGANECIIYKAAEIAKSGMALNGLPC